MANPLPNDLIDVTNQVLGINTGGGSITPDRSAASAMGNVLRPTSMRAGGITFARNPAEVQREKDIGTQDVKRKTYSKDLESFMVLDDIVHESRGDGSKRFVSGAKMAYEGFMQDTTLGKAYAAHDAAKKRLRVQLVRAAGDVGNINIVEQKAAEMLIPNGIDSKDTASIKRAYLQQIGKAINNNDENLVKEAINGFMDTPAYSDSIVTINYNGEQYNIPKDQVEEFKKDKGIK